ncbi:COG3772 Phage-related lysozyme (muraminidase) [uncultured Caudovirales phage]|uniref:Lysozyme n=1 Tax=uncultured Caudovirales phage TaxID=2100421 RepID=A0A6J5L714_9CAUD|nr:COG3772 Phage-related lysozyme (muraminidase) [uncultured Caudovirales phage]
MLTDDQKLLLKQLLVKHEGLNLFPYFDTTKHITIGVGRNLTNRGISKEEAYTLLDDDINYFSTELNAALTFFCDLNSPRQLALIDMCFNLGLKNFLEFTHMIDALKSSNYALAAKQMLESEWAKQVGQRAIDLSDIISSGEISTYKGLK